MDRFERSFYLSYNLNAFKQSDDRACPMAKTLESLENKRKELYQKMMKSVGRGIVRKTGSVCRFRGCRSGLPHSDWTTTQTVWHALDGQGSKQHHRLKMLHP